MLKRVTTTRPAMCTSWLVGTMLAASLLFPATSARAQDEPVPAQPGTPPETLPGERPESNGPPLIQWTEAAGHVGEEVTVEGRIAATHTSPLATILSFEPNFGRFTAVIRPADRAAFPPDPEEYYRGKWVRMSGRIGEYGQKAEMVLRSPRQIRVLPNPAPPAEQAALDGAGLEVLRRLTAIEESLQQIADRLDLLLAALTETPQAPAPPPEPTARLLPGRIPRREAPARPAYEALRRIKRGMTADQVQHLAGEPLFVDVGTEGGETWYYGGGSAITFNARGRVESFVGFQRR